MNQVEKLCWKGVLKMFTKTKQIAPECAEDIFCGVNIADITQAGDLEKKHLPIITAPKRVKKN